MKDYIILALFLLFAGALAALEDQAKDKEQLRQAIVRANHNASNILDQGRADRQAIESMRVNMVARPVRYKTVIIYRELP